MAPEGADADAKCPVDHQTRERWLEAAKAKRQDSVPHSDVMPSHSIDGRSASPSLRFSLDRLGWDVEQFNMTAPTQQLAPKIYRLSTDREISTIPRAVRDDLSSFPNSAERAAMRPSNNEEDTGHDKVSGNWVYPSQEMFFNAMKRKGHEAQAADMSTIVPIHNAVNERAWVEIKKWEAGRGSERCGGPKLVSFAGDSKALTPKARWNSLLGYQAPFDRHDWVIDRCGKHIDYVIDFYSGKDSGVPGKSLNFYLDVRPKVNSWEGIKMRLQSLAGW